MSVPAKVPVSVIVATKNEAAAIGRCLAALRDFAQVVVVDSGSGDGTAALAARAGADVVHYAWNGAYPKKRQWCLDTLNLAHDWVLFIDADEVITPDLVREIAALFDAGPRIAGYFITGRYVVGQSLLRHGAANRKLALFDRRSMMFPVVDDLGIAGMGEIEGHYQPVFRPGMAGRVGALTAALRHEAYGSRAGWDDRHQRYAAWEAAMSAARAWPVDPVPWRQWAKLVFRRLPFRPTAAFLHSYVWRLGLLDGRPGLDFACDRARYYRMVRLAQRSER